MNENRYLTYAQNSILEKVLEKAERNSNEDFQDLHWDDVYSVYYDSK